MSVMIMTLLLPDVLIQYIFHSIKAFFPIFPASHLTQNPVCIGDKDKILSMDQLSVPYDLVYNAMILLNNSGDSLITLHIPKYLTKAIFQSYISMKNSMYYSKPMVFKNGDPNCK